MIVRSGRALLVSAAVALVGLASTFGSATAQTIVGRVLDGVSEGPVGGVLVSLVARTGQARAQALSDSLGRFRLTPPQAGEYLLVTERFGYLETRSPLLALELEGEAPIELLISPQPVDLEGLDVSVEELAVEELHRMGLSVDALGNRWIDRRRIEAIAMKSDLGTIVERAAPAGTSVRRLANPAAGGSLCVSLARSVGGGGCALVVLDGNPISRVQALGIDPDAVESLAILEPIEASTYYGTRGGSGAVLVWTRRGR